MARLDPFTVIAMSGVSEKLFFSSGVSRNEWFNRVQRMQSEGKSDVEIIRSLRDSVKNLKSYDPYNTGWRDVVPESKKNKK